MLDWSKFIKIEYWLEGIAGSTSITPTISMDSPFLWYYLFIFSITFTFGVLLKLVTVFLHTENPISKKSSFLGSNLIWIAVIGVLWLILRQINVGFLGARLWLLFMVLWMIGVFTYLIRYFLLYFKYEYLYFQKKILTNK
jgi:hypothetical protein